MTEYVFFWNLNAIHKYGVLDSYISLDLFSCFLPEEQVIFCRKPVKLQTEVKPPVRRLPYSVPSFCIIDLQA